MATINRIPRLDGPARARRSDAGQSRHGITDEVIEECLALYWHDHHPLQDCVAIMKRDGKIPPGRFSAATLLRELKKRTGGGREISAGCPRLKTAWSVPTAPFISATARPTPTTPGSGITRAASSMSGTTGASATSLPMRSAKTNRSPIPRAMLILGIKDDFLLRDGKFVSRLSFYEFDELQRLHVHRHEG
ncbi:MAG: hypothetical protein MZV65_38380 [Chromatiales bacterium]|nr:hypothetical protein [Chromatiales bacterium]